MSIYKDFVSSFLPDGILEYFEITDFNKDGDQLRVYLEETTKIPQQYCDEHYRLNGFLPEIKVRDFPIRDLFVVLHIKRRRWLLVNSERKVTRDWNLVAPGTRLTSQFADFLKELA